MSLLTSIRASFKTQQAAAAAPVVVEEVKPVEVVAPKYLSKAEEVLTEKNQSVQTQIKDCEDNLKSQNEANKALAEALKESKKLADRVPEVRADLLKAFEEEAELQRQMEEALLAFKDLGL